MTHLEGYKRQLERLHALFLCGQDDSPQADALRDEMDVNWRGMTPEEIEQVDGYSALLYRISDEGKLLVLDEQEIQPCQQD